MQEEARKGNALTLLKSELVAAEMENKHVRKYSRCVWVEPKRRAGVGGWRQRETLVRRSRQRQKEWEDELFLEIMMKLKADLPDVSSVNIPTVMFPVILA